MDGRLPARRVFYILLAGLVGCQSSKPGGPSLSQIPRPYRPEAGESTIARAVSTSDYSKKEPVKASTMVAVGAYREQMAANPDLSFADAEQVRSAARAAYQDALKIDPKCVPAYIGLAKSFVVIEDSTQAYAMYDKALAQIPNDASIWYEKGLTHARFKDWDGAITSLARASSIDPDNRQYKRTIGMTQARAGRFNDAFASLRPCMKEEEIYYNLARMSVHLDRSDLAREYLTMSVKAHPTYMPAHEMISEMNRGNAVQQVGYQQPAVKVGDIE